MHINFIQKDLKATAKKQILGVRVGVTKVANPLNKQLQNNKKTKRAPRGLNLQEP